jgi:DNA-binding winged helix-turn-helix (wHTH) protein/Tol biopolymer transport system component
MNQKTKQFYVFGPFSLDASSRLLLKDGQPVSLPPKAVETLIVLVQNAGQLVDKDELMKKVWQDTFVEEGNLTKNIFVLRKSLAEIDREQYIETIPKHGYRFVACVQLVTNPAAATALSPPASLSPPNPQELEASPTKGARWNWAALLGAGLALASLIALAVWFTKRPGLSPLDVKQRQLTFSSSDNPVRFGAISPDGRYLAYADLAGIHLMLIETGESQTIPQPEVFQKERNDWQEFRWFPDGTGFLVNQNPPPEREGGYAATIWSVSVLGGPPRKLREMAGAEAISPDGAFIGFSTEAWDFWVMGPNGEGARKVFQTGPPGGSRYYQWSPSSHRIAYIRDPEGSIESRDLKDGKPTIMLPPTGGRVKDIEWLPDGRLIYSLKELPAIGDTCNLWAVQVDERSGLPRASPRRLTNWAGSCVENFSASANGKRLAYEQWTGHAGVYVADLLENGKRITTPRRLTLGESWNVPVAWSADSKAVVFKSRFNGQMEMLEQTLGEDSPRPILRGLSNVSDRAPLSPDGRWFLYSVDGTSSQPPQVMLVPVSGGSPQVVATGMNYGVRCAKAPASLCVVAERSRFEALLIFFEFDPLRGRGRELLRIATQDSEYAWDLSPDATRIAILESLTGKTSILSLAGKPPIGINADSIKTSTFLDWAPDGQGLFVSQPTSRGFALLYMDLQGKTRTLWEQEGSLGISALPSPDGRHIAIRGWNVNSNIWMIEGF